MRMRKKKRTGERMEACSALLIASPEENPGKWRSLFPKNAENAPLELEIGCGKGAFICEMAKKHPERDFLALEFCREALMLALEKAKGEEIPNLFFINADAKNLPLYFAPGEISRIDLNFSDPWPKKRHAKRRLTAPSFLEAYRLVLEDGGEIRQKTDNTALFDFSLESYAAAGWEVRNISRDLHHSPEAEENIMTEYEKHFSDLGMPICAVTAVKK